jgi:hypothetical protein
MGKRLLYVMLLLAVLFSVDVYSQGVKRMLTGTVVDDSGSPVIGATVMEEGSSNGTTTDTNGHYSRDLCRLRHLGIFIYRICDAEIKPGARTV